MSALNDLVTGALLGKVAVGTTEKAILELAELYREIDNYDRICTEVRNELTAAGIPELTEDKLKVLPLKQRVSLLRERLARAMKLLREHTSDNESGAFLASYSAIPEQYYEKVAKL